MTVLKNMEFEMIDGIELLDTVCQDEIPAVIVVPQIMLFLVIQLLVIR